MNRKEALNIISESSVYGNLGLFIGAGMSMAILNDEWQSVALSWKELIFKCAQEFDIDLKEDVNKEGLSYPEIATEIAKIIAEKNDITYSFAIKRLKEKICDLTSWYPEEDKRNEYGKLLLDIDPSWIITTNYDLIIECILTGKCISLEPNDQLISPQRLIPVYHLHGIRTNPSSIIISQEDYISLFRPNQYRQQKLSLSIKESTTLIIGYGLGDVNVLTAVDWTKNVYSQQRINYPHDIIQLLYCKDPAPNPYRDRNDILILEFDDLQEILSEIADSITKATEIADRKNLELIQVNEVLKNPSEKDVDKFIDDDDFRLSIIKEISEDGIQLISGFLELFSKAMDKTWERATPRNAFHAYKENLQILLDIIEQISLQKIPPALMQSIAYNLDRVSYYVGEDLGESRAAYRMWNNRKDNIPIETMTEIKNIAVAREYYRIKRLYKN